MNESEVKEVTPDPVKVEEVKEVDMQDTHEIIEHFKSVGLEVQIKHHRQGTLVGDKPVYDQYGGATTFRATMSTTKTRPKSPKEPEVQTTGEVNFLGASRCSMSDIFCKKKGAQIAANRAMKAYITLLDLWK